MHLPRLTAWLAAIVCLLGAFPEHARTRQADSEEKVLLRWDLPEGSVWTLHVHQQYESRVGFSGKTADTHYDLTMDVTWRVVARQQERMTIRQTVDRIVLEVTPPTGSTLRFDSASQERPAGGPAADLAAAVRPLVGATFELVQTLRGEIDDVQPVGQVAKQWFARSESDPGDPVAVQAALRGVVGQSLLTLPEQAIAPQETWRHVRTVPSPLGQVQVHTTYRLDRPAPHEDKTLWPIRFTAEITVPSPAQDEAKPPAAAQGHQPPDLTGTTRRNPIQVKQFEQSGTVWFSVEQSHPVKAELQNRVWLTHVYRDLSLAADTKLRQQVTLQPKKGAASLPSDRAP